MAGFEVEMDAQRARSKESRESIDLTAQSALAEMAQTLPATTVSPRLSPGRHQHVLR